MSEQISPTTASLSAQALTLVSREIRTRQDSAERAQAANRREAAPKRRAEAAEAVKKQEERLSSRVDQLVQSKKAVSSRISSESVSPPQRTVLVSRANDLQRQVNELDGIIGGEGQGDLSNAAALTAKPQVAAASSSTPRPTGTIKLKAEALAPRSQVEALAVKPQAAETPSPLRSAPAHQQQPSAGALRAFAKNSPAASATASADLAGATSNQVDLMA